MVSPGRATQGFAVQGGEPRDEAGPAPNPYKMAINKPSPEIRRSRSLEKVRSWNRFQQEQWRQEAHVV